MGDRVQADEPSRYVTAAEVDSAFYPPWDGKMSTVSAFGLSNNNKWPVAQASCLGQKVGSLQAPCCIHCVNRVTLTMVRP